MGLLVVINVWFYIKNNKEDNSNTCLTLDHEVIKPHILVGI